jgi:hypothetical protein
MVTFLLGLIGFGHAEQEPLFRLVGVYDSSGVLGVSDGIGERYLWNPDQKMLKSCGPSKSPDALGVFEAEAIANQMMPTLAVVLEHTDEPFFVDKNGNPCAQQEDDVCETKPRPQITNQDVTIGLGINQVEYRLQPMVLPRYLSISIDGFTEQQKAEKGTDREGLFDTSRYQKLIRTQLEIELCLEHKVGRGWLGNDENRLRQAFLLDPPDNNQPDRKYFGGQRDPIPGLLGPNNACIVSTVEMPSDALASKGEGNMMLTPSDVWGASLRDCNKEEEDAGKIVKTPTKLIPLEMSENGIRQARKQPAKWRGLEIKVEARGETENDVFIDVTLDDQPVEGLNNVQLFPKPGAMLDILARLNHEYPRVGSKLDRDRFVVLLIPNWQIVEGLRRMYSRQCTDDTAELLCKCSVRDVNSPIPKEGDLTERLNVLDQRLLCKDIDGEICSLSRTLTKDATKSPAEICLQSMDVSQPMESIGEGLYDGVGWLLAHPKQLFVQVGTKTVNNEGFQILEWLSFDKKENKPGQLPNLAGVTSGGFMGLQDWGYTVGQLAGRAPIILPSEKRVTWDVSADAQRYKQHSYFIFACFILLTLVIRGFRRITDYWTPIPEERAYYWPGRQASNESQEAEGVELDDSGGEG